jgi:hypothetical protein
VIVANAAKGGRRQGVAARRRPRRSRCARAFPRRCACIRAMISTSPALDRRRRNRALRRAARYLRRDRSCRSRRR